MDHKRKTACRIPALLFCAAAVILIFSLSGCGRKDLPSGNPVGSTDRKGPGTPDGDSLITGNHEAQKDINASEDDSAGKKTPSPEPEILHVGDSFQDGDMRIVYMSSGKYTEENEYLQPEAGSGYIYLAFSFENTSGERDGHVSLFSFSCFADGYAAQPYFGTDNELSASLPPGRSTSGCAYFLVPEDAKEIDVEYTPASPGSGKAVFVYEGTKDSGYTLPSDPTPSRDALAPGGTYSSDKVNIHYLSCEKDTSDNTFVQPAAGCSFHTLTVSFENLQTEDLELSFYDFTCYADGQACRSVYFRDDALSATVPSGRRAKGTVTFEVPDNAQTVEAEYRTGITVKTRVLFKVR